MIHSWSDQQIIRCLIKIRGDNMNPSKPVTLVLIGAGARGDVNLGILAKRNADEMKFVAVAEPNDKRRESFRRAFNF